MPNPTPISMSISRQARPPAPSPTWISREAVSRHLPDRLAGMALIRSIGEVRKSPEFHWSPWSASQLHPGRHKPRRFRGNAPRNCVRPFHGNARSCRGTGAGHRICEVSAEALGARFHKPFPRKRAGRPAAGGISCAAGSRGNPTVVGVMRGASREHRQYGRPTCGQPRSRRR